jgi:mannonate dehydratase
MNFAILGGKLPRRKFTRRKLIQGIGVAALSPAAILSPAFAALRTEGPGTPKLCMNISLANLNEAGMRRIKQLGVDNVLLADSPPIPWDEATIRSIMEKLKAGGLTLGNMMIPWMSPSGTANASFAKAIYGLPGRDEEIEKVRHSIRAAGHAGLPVVEYNFYAHRITEGYSQEPGRGGAGMSHFDYNRVKDLPPRPEEGAHSLDEMWANLTYFVKAVIPVAEESDVRMALHPNDPPPPISRGSGQPMGSLEGWKRLIDIVPSKSNGITFDCGVTRELGQDPVEVCRYFGSRDRINHVHYRNVITEVPREKYTEVFPDNGEVDMLAVMKELVRQKYPRLIYPEHPRALDADRDQPKSGSYTGWVYNVAYARAMLQAALANQ